MKEIVPDKIIHSKRKSIGLEIHANGELIIRAPIKATSEYIQKIISKKGDWIRKKKVEALKRTEKIVTKKFVENEEFFVLGKVFKLKFASNQLTDVVLDEFVSVSKSKEKNAENIILSWYKKLALEKISERIKFLSKKHGFGYQNFQISNAKTKWGSCDTRNNIKISWRLIMAPMDIIDYVIIHELVHTVHKNHSQKFWNEVKNILPNFKNAKNWLKENGNQLIF